MARSISKWPPLAICLLVFAIYWPGRGGGFVFDDFPNIVDNIALHVTDWDKHAWLAAIFSSDSGLDHRPLPMATFALNHVFTGLNPMPMKLTNIAIHALNACLVLGLLRTLLLLAVPAIDARRREWSARFVAAAWALHPINLMAVLYVVQRMESLCHSFVFAGLWLYLLGRRRQLAGQRGGEWRIVAGILGGTVLGLLCKESAVLLPLYAAFVELCLLGARDAVGRRDRRLLAFFGIVLVLPALLGLAWLLPKVITPVAYATRDFDVGERLLTEGRVVLDYLRWTLLPSLRQFGLYHDDLAISRGLWQPASTAFALLALALLAAVAVVVRRRRPLIALGIAWFLGAQLLTATVVPLELVFEHRNYFASLGVCIAVADLLLLLPRHESVRRIGTLLAVLWILLLGMTTFLRAKEWSDPLRFAASEAAKHPQSPRSTYDHARVLAIATGYRADSPLLPQAFEALERARTVPDSGILPYSALLILAARTGTPVRQEWWDGMDLRLRKNPLGVQETNAIASITRCVRNKDCIFPQGEMRAMYDAARSHGRNAEICNIQADYTFNVLRQPDEGLQLWQCAVDAKPGEPQYRINRARGLIAVGRFDDARKEISALRAMDRMGDGELAVRELEDRIHAAETPR